jgi:hypothetical protein
MHRKQCNQTSAFSSLYHGISVCSNFTGSDFSYGIKAAWSDPFHSTYYNKSVNALDEYTKHLDPPMLPFTRRAGRNDRAKTALDLRAIDPEFAEFDREFGGECNWDNENSGDQLEDGYEQASQPTREDLEDIYG